MNASLSLALGLVALVGTSFAPVASASTSPLPPLDTTVSLLSSPVGGPKFYSGNVDAFGRATIQVTLRGGELSRIRASGDGDTDLDYFLYDQGGHLLESDVDYGDDGLIFITPIWTGPFTLVIVNRGSVFNHVNVWVN